MRWFVCGFCALMVLWVISLVGVEAIWFVTEGGLCIANAIALFVLDALIVYRGYRWVKGLWKKFD